MEQQVHGIIKTPASARQDLTALKTSLTDLAHEITTCHHAASAALGQAAEHAMAAGDLLIKVRLELGHGPFGEWVEANCKMSYRTARVYMQLAQNRDAIEAGMKCHSDMSIRGCLRLIGQSGGSSCQDGSDLCQNDPEPSLRQWRPKQTTRHDIMEAWMHASAEERERFVHSVGRDLEHWQPDNVPAAAPKSPPTNGAPPADVSIPDDLSIPTFLRRQVAGPTLSDTALHCATLGWRAE